MSLLQSSLQADKFQTFQSGRRNQFQRNEHLVGGRGVRGGESVPYFTDYSQGNASCPKSRPLTGSWPMRIKITSLISRICTLRFHKANFIVWTALAKLYNTYKPTWTIKTVKISYYFSPNAGLSDYIQQTLIELLLHRFNSKYHTVMTTGSVLWILKYCLT